MNEELQRKLVEILSSIQEAAKAGGDFAMSQLPDIAQSYVTYGRVISTAGVLLFAAVFIGGLYALLWGIFSKENDSWGGMADRRVCAIFGGGMVGLCALIPLSINATDAVLVWFAPKVWLLKEFAGMLK